MKVDYLRISITNRCNLRCVYCNPRGDFEAEDGPETLSFDEICRIARLCSRCGVGKIRLTGGEPLLRKNVVDLVRKLARIDGIEDLSMTTNGVLLAPLTKQLKDAGLNRINVSLDAAQESCYRQITGCDALSRVIDGIEKAVEVGLMPVKVNCVVLQDVNFSQVVPLAKMSLRLPISIRFIEYCPTSSLTGPADGYVPNEQVRSRIESHLGRLIDLPAADSGGPAVYARVEGAMGTIGFISGRSSRFCHRCSRLRLTSDGRLRPCLHVEQSYDLRTLLRGGANNQAILQLIKRALREKGAFTRFNSGNEEFLMQHIGG
jgi:cyclic pyranopterin phosphate synthase